MHSPLAARRPTPNERPRRTPSDETSDPHDSPSALDARPDAKLALAIYQIVMRTGWIFKTESIIMPAVMDSISGAGWLRGCLPLLNRFGHSIPPLLLARRVKLSPRKKWIVCSTTTLMSVLFLALTWLFAMGYAHRSWMPAAFLGIYLAFFACIGVNQLAFTTLQGKLVAVNRRGRLLLVSNTVGAATAIVCAFLLLPRWLVDDGARFDWIFGFSGVLFGVSAIATLLAREPADSFHEPPAAHFGHYFVDAARTLSNDRNFRRLAVVAALFGVSFMLFPHYQNLGLRVMDLRLRSLMWWVIIQNIGTGAFSVPIGAVADRSGNRRVLQLTLLGIAAAPALAIALLYAGVWGARLYHSVFVLVGLTPVVLRTLQNYTLEITPPENHPRYLSTLNLCIAAPMFLSLAAGYVIDTMGFEVVFLTSAALILLAWGLCFGLEEPRAGNVE